MKRGDYVSRSTYQKVAEENKKLLNDIRILVQERTGNAPPVEKLFVLEKWRKKFAQDRELFELLKDMFGKKTIVDESKVIIKAPIMIHEHKSEPSKS